MFLNFLKKNTPRFLYDILKMIYHILRYYGLINPNYSTSNLVRFGEKKCGNFIKKKILKSNFILNLVQATQLYLPHKIIKIIIL